MAQLLTDARRRRLILAVVARERSLKDLSELIGIPLNLAHYHVRQLMHYGLVEVAREQRRAGRPMRFYRSRFSRFEIPMSLLGKPPTDAVARKLANAIEHARDLAGGSVLLDVDDDGRPRMRELPGEGVPPLEIWRRLTLRREEAEALFEELTRVIHRHSAAARAGGQQWTLHLALAETEA